MVRVADNQKNEEIVLEYLVEQYRPFAVNDILNNLHAKIPKKQAVVKALESLQSQNRIFTKTFGKITIYSCHELPLTIPGDKTFSFQHLTELREEALALDKDFQAHTTNLAAILKNPSNKELVESIDLLQKNLLALQSKVDELSQNWDAQRDANISNLIAKESMVQKYTNARRKMIKRLLEVIKDSCKPKNMDEFLENIGYEN